jgi:hypothetical protein
VGHAGRFPGMIPETPRRACKVREKEDPAIG